MEAQEIMLEFDVSESFELTDRIDGVVIGKIIGLSVDGRVRVDFKGNPYDMLLTIATMVRVTEADSGRRVALQFVEGVLQNPIIMGFICDTDAKVDANNTQEFISDGERIELTAKKEIVFKCGDSSLTLTRAGKIILRGKYLLSQSSGVNKIKGGSVQIN